ncbi:glycogen debranching protein GlgX [Pantoea sp. 1.19]|uniref:glycogen debranching protein GlgX n=1 Tax=Pantoea sp. 1.19 TaxID=1925589 RepID=UPI0009491509|nr:glycogen debranching protein GlgX [Pantoea sp. 1.19]
MTPEPERLASHPGQPEPLGAHWQGDGVNFVLFSAHAEQVILCLFDDRQREIRIPLTARTGDRWHIFVPGLRPGQRYGYRVAGPWQPEQGHRFNSAKLLVDPCARQVIGEVGQEAQLYGGEWQRDEQDSAAVAPKSVVIADDFDWQGDAPLRTPWGETVIYEAHVRGLTQLHPEIPAPLRGTYRALGHPVMIAYLQRLGITALELLPVATFADEPRLQARGLRNYWGYNPYALSAPSARYAAGVDPLRELQEAVRALHQAGIEVILDVVFNHTAELEEIGPTLSLRGVDNKSYYWHEEEGRYANWTGCGNTLNLSHPAVIDWTLDCLRFWVEHAHIDGFRFDLAPVLGRTPAFDAAAPLFQALAADPLLSTCKLIAEPWDIGPEGYRLGQFPAPFAEWNDRFRDGLRRFWLCDDAGCGELANRLSASRDLFNPPRRPAASINLITAHDGFTLRDLVSFDHKHNEANGEENRDGHDANYSGNQGVEGLDAPPAVQQARRVRMQALLTTLLLAQGTPMLLAGDELGHSQQGNNNAYCQDNPTTWLHWQEADSALQAFTARVIQLRKRIPALTGNRWWQEGDGNVEWLNGRGTPMTRDDWEQGPRHLQIMLSGRGLIVLNGEAEPAAFILPEGEWLPVTSDDGEPGTILLAVWHGAAHAACVFHKR